jgi:HK97 gp10 family phage protein
MSTSIRLEGLEGALESLENIVNTENLERALGQACALVERSAKQKAPKDSGELRRSIASKLENEGNTLVGVVYTPLTYAPYVEFGTGLFAESDGRKNVPWCYKDDQGEWHSTSGQKPHPFMRPALEENRDQILRILKEGLNND